MKQQFPKLNLRKLSHEQLRTVLTRILESWSGRDSIPPTITLLLVKLGVLLNLLDKILLQERASELTKKVNDTDEKRDRAYRYLLRKIRFALDEFDETLVTAATTLTPVIAEFGVDIANLAQVEQSARTSLAVQEFRKTNNLAALTTLEAVVDLDRVETLNTEFEAVRKERAKLESGKEELPRLYSLRRELIATLTLLIKVSEFLYNENHNSVDKELFDIINAELTDASALVKMRETLSESVED